MVEFYIEGKYREFVEVVDKVAFILYYDPFFGAHTCFVEIKQDK
jgi:hypothetical protein